MQLGHLLDKNSVYVVDKQSNCYDPTRVNHLASVWVNRANLKKDITDAYKLNHFKRWKDDCGSGTGGIGAAFATSWKLPFLAVAEVLDPFVAIPRVAKDLSDMGVHWLLNKNEQRMGTPPIADDTLCQVNFSGGRREFRTHAELRKGDIPLTPEPR